LTDLAARAQNSLLEFPVEVSLDAIEERELEGVKATGDPRCELLSDFAHVSGTVKSSRSYTSLMAA
jgi:hypothetical protein